jgi:hypothetical protein
MIAIGIAAFIALGLCELERRDAWHCLRFWESSLWRCLRGVRSVSTPRAAWRDR